MKLRDWMKKNRWTQTAFALESGIHLRTLCYILKGGMPNLINAIKINQFTNGQVKFEDLLHMNKKKSNHAKQNEDS